MQASTAASSATTRSRTIPSNARSERRAQVRRRVLPVRRRSRSNRAAPADEGREAGTALAKNRCGLQFKATGSDFFADHCWQRDQPGVPTTRVPACKSICTRPIPVAATIAARAAASTAITAWAATPIRVRPRRAAATCRSRTAASRKSCDPRGVYAMRLGVDLAWGGRSGGLVGLTDDGRGELGRADARQDRRGRRRQHGHERHDARVRRRSADVLQHHAVRGVSADLPGRDVHSKAMPAFDIGGHMQCLSPGCIASIDAQTYLLGIELNNPEAPWPTSDQTAVAHLQERQGHAVLPRSRRRHAARPDRRRRDDRNLDRGHRLQHPSTRTRARRSAPASARSSTACAAPIASQLGVRMKIGASMKFGDDCVTGNGAGIAEFVNSRAWGCLVQPGTYNFPFGMPAPAPNDPCTSAEASFMDANLPIYDVLNVGETPRIEPATSRQDAEPRAAGRPGEARRCRRGRELRAGAQRAVSVSEPPCFTDWARTSRALR